MIELFEQVRESIQRHSAWLGRVSGLLAEKMLRGKERYLYVLRKGEADDYYVTFVLPNGFIKHQPFALIQKSEGWYCKTDRLWGPFRAGSIEDALPLIMHCREGECTPFIIKID